MFESKEASFALSTAQKLSGLLRQIQQELTGSVITKQDHSPVTVADFAVQAIVSRLLQDAFPELPLVAEEQADALRAEEERDLLEQVTRYVQRVLPQATPQVVCEWIDRGKSSGDADRFWTLDPVDGTKGFLRGEQYALALALVAGGRVEFGVLACPNLAHSGHEAIGGEGAIVVAERGSGAWSAAASGGPLQALRVSELSEPRRARILRSVESGHTNADDVGRLAAELKSRAEPIRMDSQAKYVVLAAGQGELLVRFLSPSRPDYREKIWDQAAGMIVTQEAGGEVTDLDGKPLEFSHGQTLSANRGVLASNGRLHRVALEAIAKLGA